MRTYHANRDDMIPALNAVWDDGTHRVRNGATNGAWDATPLDARGEALLRAELEARGADYQMSGDNEWDRPGEGE